MSKAARKRNKARRDLEKRKRKDAMRALYASWRDQGINAKKGVVGSKKAAGPSPQSERRNTKAKKLWYGEYLQLKHKERKQRRTDEAVETLQPGLFK